MNVKSEDLARVVACEIVGRVASLTDRIYAMRAAVGQQQDTLVV